MDDKTQDIQDYSYVNSNARVAIYDDFKSSPRIVDVKGDSTRDFIGNLSAEVYRLSKEAGGEIAYSVIKQLCENFIHANFCEMVVSIMDGGNVIKFSDQGPGIENKENAKLPGFSSATSEMKQFIDGVGSGLPIANDYMIASSGSLTIEDNIKSGTVVTLALRDKTAKSNLKVTSNKHKSTDDETEIYASLIDEITERGKLILNYVNSEKMAGIKEIAEEFSLPNSSVHSEFSKLESMNLVKKVGTKRALTSLGEKIVEKI